MGCLLEISTLKYELKTFQNENIKRLRSLPEEWSFSVALDLAMIKIIYTLRFLFWRTPASFSDEIPSLIRGLSSNFCSDSENPKTLREISTLFRFDFSSPVRMKPPFQVPQ